LWPILNLNLFFERCTQSGKNPFIFAICVCATRRPMCDERHGMTMSKTWRCAFRVAMRVALPTRARQSRSILLTAYTYLHHSEGLSICALTYGFALGQTFTSTTPLPPFGPFEAGRAFNSLGAA
jgi:hypothetical protein